MGGYTGGETGRDARYCVVLAKVFLSGVTIMGTDLSLGSIDGVMVAALLTPTLGSYVARKYTDRKFDQPDDGEEAKDGKGT